MGFNDYCVNKVFNPCQYLNKCSLIMSALSYAPWYNMNQLTKVLEIEDNTYSWPQPEKNQTIPFFIIIYDQLSDKQKILIVNYYVDLDI